MKIKDVFLVIVNNKEIKKAKGFNKDVVKNIRYKECIYVLFNRSLMLHKIGTYDVCKFSWSCFDDKRYILDDGINSLVYFHESVKS